MNPAVALAISVPLVSQLYLLPSGTKIRRLARSVTKQWLAGAYCFLSPPILLSMTARRFQACRGGSPSRWHIHWYHHR